MSARLLTAVLSLVASAAVAVAAPPAPAAAAAVFVPARGAGGAAVGPATTVATGSFREGLRFVTATVRGRIATGSARRPTMLSVKLICGDESVQATTNVLSSTVLRPRRLMRDATDCRVVAHSAISRAVARDGLTVTAEIRSEAVGWGAVGYRPDGWPSLVRAGARKDVVPLDVTAPDEVDTVYAYGDVKVTTCTSVGGSRENGSPSLCRPNRLNPKGSRMQLTLVAEQKSTTGGICARRTLATRTVTISAKVHHATVPLDGTYTMSRAATCGRDVHFAVTTRIISGADAVLHRAGTISNIMGW